MSDDTVDYTCSGRGEENIDDITTEHSGSSGVEQEVIDIRQQHCHGDQTAMKTLKQALEKANIGGPLNDVQIIVVGKTGTGKSALINSITDLEREIAKEGGETNRCSETVRKYYCSDVVPGVNVTVIDTPGLQDIHQQEQSYIQEMKKKCGEVTLVLYCMKMIDHRLTNDDKVAMQKLHEAFGPKFWERVKFVLTFANYERCDQRDNRDEQDPEPPYSDEVAWKELIKKRFSNRIVHRDKAINSFLESTFSIKRVPFLVAGTYKPSYTCPNPKSLPDRDNWLLDFLTFCCNEIKEKHRFSKLNLNNKIHFAIIIDNHEKVQEVNRVSDQVDALKETLECLGFCVLYFNYLSSQSISCLLESFHQVDYSQLASFALVFLSKGHTNDLYSPDRPVTFEEVFKYFDDIIQVPKLFLFHLAHSGKPLSDRLKFPNPPKNSIALIVSLKLTANTNVSPAISAMIINLKPEECCVKSLKQCFGQMKHHIDQLDLATCDYKNNLQDNFVLPIFCGENDYQLLEKKHSLCYAMWYPIRCKTIDVVLENKDEVMSIVRYERISKLVTAAGGIVGAGMIGMGLFFSVPTMGISMGLTTIGGLVSGVSAGSSLISFLTSTVTTNSRLKKVQQFVRFDQQFSNQLNAAAAKYSKALETYKGGTLLSAGAKVVVGAVSAARGLVEEGGEIALRAASGVLVAVTVPIDVAQFVYNCYLLHESSQDETGQSDSNTTIQCLIKQFEASLKGFFHVIMTLPHAYDGNNSFPEYGYKVILPPTCTAPRGKPDVTVSTILSGPFNVPDGAVLVSAVYDIMIDENFKKSITVEIEHCVDVLDESIAGEMFFAIAKADLTTKSFGICPIDGGTFPNNSTYGSIKVKESCLLCVLVKDPLKVRYTVQYSFTKNYENFWLMKATFTKNLAAFTKFVSEDSRLARGFSDRSFHLIEPHLELQEFKRTVIHNGWTISFDDSNPKENIPKTSLDNIGLIKSGITLKQMIPFIRLFVTKNEESNNEFNFGIPVPGTDPKLLLSINSRNFCN